MTHGPHNAVLKPSSLTRALKRKEQETTRGLASEADRIMRASLKARADILEWEALELVQKAHELREAVNRLENAS
jgi:hypothetical protein